MLFCSEGSWQSDTVVLNGKAREVLRGKTKLHRALGLQNPVVCFPASREVSVVDWTESLRASLRMCPSGPEGDGLRSGYEEKLKNPFHVGFGEKTKVFSSEEKALVYVDQGLKCRSDLRHQLNGFASLNNAVLNAQRRARLGIG